MTHGEPYEFIRLGLQLERAAKTVRIVVVALPGPCALDEDDPARARQLIALLESCSAFEAFVKRHGTLFEPSAIAEQLIRSADFPPRGAVLRREQPRRRNAHLERPGRAPPDPRPARRRARVRRAETLGPCDRRSVLRGC